MILRIAIALLVIVTLITIPAVILANSNDEEEVGDMNVKVNLPLIDTIKPAVTEIATFALG
jgi:hypothetical protein